MKLRLLVLALLFSGFAPSIPVRGATAQVKIGEIMWYTSYDQAMTLARQQQKPVWIHFGENPG